jgi:hypothetical protein
VLFVRHKQTKKHRPRGVTLDEALLDGLVSRRDGYSTWSRAFFSKHDASAALHEGKGGARAVVDAESPFLLGHCVGAHIIVATPHIDDNTGFDR